MALLRKSPVRSTETYIYMFSVSLLSLRRDPRIVKLPPYLSALLIIIGAAWLFTLPLNEYSRQTYISENALLPGQVHTYFGGSEHNVFRAYRQEVGVLNERSEEERYQGIEEIFRSNGLKAATQSWKYERAGQIREGKNVYAVLQGPRADATEAMVLIGAWRNMNGDINYSGVALVLAFARYFKRWSMWSKDIIFVIPSDSISGPQAWVDAYHDSHDPTMIESLAVKSGALQGAIALDYPAPPWGQRFDKLNVVYDGVNGQLPNLDLVNTAVSVASGQMGIGCTIQKMWNHGDSYQERLQTIFRGMVQQAAGFGSGPHSSFMAYHVDAITLQTVGEDGWHDEMSLGRAVEGTFRSLNNLLEHLHQSFFFYLLMHANRFVSIGTYLPSAMLIAGNFSITSILLWVLSGRPAMKKSSQKADKPTDEKSPMEAIEVGDSVALVPAEELEVAEREMFLPLAIVFAAHAFGFVPLYALNQIPDQVSIIRSNIDRVVFLILTMSHRARLLTRPL